MTDKSFIELMVNLKAIDYKPVGSRVTCRPAPVKTDEDWLVLCPNRHYVGVLDEEGWQLDGSGHYEPSEGVFSSWRKGDVNLIVTDSRRFYELFLCATQIAKELNLLEKKDRIALFQAILYGDTPLLKRGEWCCPAPAHNANN